MACCPNIIARVHICTGGKEKNRELFVTQASHAMASALTCLWIARLLQQHKETQLHRHCMHTSDVETRIDQN
jgi:hypothetical protein